MRRNVFADLYKPRVTCAALVAVLALALSGCVTTKTGAFTDANEEQALEASLQLARTYIGDRNWDAAKRHLKNALEIDEHNGEVHEALALVYQNGGEMELAGHHYERAMRFSGNQSRIRMNYASFLYGQQRYQEAEKLLQQVVDDVLYEHRASAFVSLGRVRMRLEKFEQAQQAFHRAFLLNRDSPVAVFELADAYYALENYAQSQRFYQRFREMVKQQTARTLWLGIRLAAQFDDRDALSSYSMALKNLYPKSEEYLRYRAQFEPDA